MKSWLRWGGHPIFLSGAGLTVLRAEHAPKETRICGLNAFSPEHGSLFLPRLLWRRTAGNATLRLQLWSDSSLQDDARTALELLQQLRPARAIRPLSVELSAKRICRKTGMVDPDRQGDGDYRARRFRKRSCLPGPPICSVNSGLILSH